MTARPALRIASAVACLALGGCYTLQAARGQVEVLAARRPIAKVLADPATDAATAEALAIAVEARDLARAGLGLRSRSYEGFVRLEREWLLWNVVVAPELELAPRPQCFVLVGCLAYRGFFAEDAARAAAERARARGDDAYIGPVPAYSTLGWFDDPVYWTMLRWDGPTLAAMVAHELAHEALYTGDDSGFDEAFAETVGDAVATRVFAAPDRAEALVRWRERRAREDAWTRTVLAARGDLAAIYAGPLDPEAKRAAKRERLARLAAEVGGEWNNARLALIATYDSLKPGFAALLAEEGGDLARFLERARRLARLPPEARREALADALARAQRPYAARAAG